MNGNSPKLKNAAALYPIEPANPAAANFVVIPVFDENSYICATLESVKKALDNSPQPVAVILVLNEPASASAEARQRNRELLESLQKNDGKYDGGLILGRELFYINLLDKEIKEKFRTVGNARKTGFDGAILQSDGKVTDQKGLLFSLDADTLVSEKYFINAFEHFKAFPENAGAVFNFKHRLEAEHSLQLAAMRYEIYLLDYALKMHRSGSHYGFWTIGSAFACTVRDYLRCGGMRRHAAGEDFYFLQALRKVGKVGVISEVSVYPAGRISDRVPFGTGPAIARQLAGELPGLYNPRQFELLKDFFDNCRNSDYDNLAGSIMSFTPGELAGFLQAQNFAEIWAKIVKNTPRDHKKLLDALHTYCDGFFILKFSHFLEEHNPDDFGRIKMYADCKLTSELECLRNEVMELFG
jgi:hypothetical protein